MADGIISVPAGYFMVADSAFPTKGLAWIKKAGNQQRAAADLQAVLDHYGDVHHPEAVEARRALLYQRSAITSVRQLSEWGNAAVTRVFQRLRTPLPCDHERRRKLIAVVLRLYNVRTRLLCANNQIKTVFAPGYDGPLQPPVKKASFFNNVVVY